MSSDSETVAALRAENVALQQRVAELEQRVAESQKQFHGLIEYSPSAMFVKNLDGHTMIANPQLGIMFNMEPESIIGKTVYELVPVREMAEAIWQSELAIIHSGKPSTVEETIMSPSGVRNLITSKFPIYNEQNEVYAIGGIITDVTEQKQAEQVVRNSEERLRSIIDKLPIGVCITSEDYIFEEVNPAYCEIYQYARDELIGQPFTMVVPEAGRQRARELHDQFMQQGKEIRGEWHVVRKDGTPLTVLADAAAIIGADGKPKKATFVIDISDRKQAEHDRQALQEQVIAAQQNAIRELSTPMIPLSGHVVLMPLVGSIDSNRAQLVMETLLEGIASHQADVAILDITGVSVVDTQVANALIQAAQAARLLGAQVVLTGIGPVMAQTLVHLGADLSSITTRGSLQSAVLEALKG